MKYLFIIAIVAFSSANCQINNSIGHSKHKTVIELFTSEGCSSCPAAEQYTEELAKDTNIIVLSYHVDYWNRLGSVDSFSNHSFSEKQYHYGELFHLSSVYTPQAVINGKAEAVGSNRKTIPQLIKSAAGFDNIISSVQTSFNNNMVSVNAVCNTKNIGLEFLLIQKNASTHILAGENNGSTLHHLNIVRQSVQSKNVNSAQLNWKKNEDRRNYKIVVLARDLNTYAIKDVTAIDL